MIIGIGVDMIEISRIKSAVAKDSFKKRVFTEKEIAQSKDSDAFYAGNFAVKEAVSKCFGTGVSGFELKDIEVLRDDLGKPYVCLKEPAAKIFSNLGGGRIETSISDTDTLVVAFAVIETA